MLENHGIDDIAAQRAAIPIDAEVVAHPKIANPFADHQAIAPLAGHGAPAYP